MSHCVVEYELSWLASYSDVKYIFTPGKIDPPAPRFNQNLILATIT